MVFNGITCTKRYCIILSVLFLGAFILIFAGCSPVSMVKKTGRKISRGFRSSEGNLKMRVGVVPFVNGSSFSTQNTEGILQNAVVKTISTQCGNTFILKPGDQEYPEELAHLTRLPSGGIDSFSLATAGRQYGLNAILTGRLVDIHDKEEERGFLWFKDTHYFVQFAINIEVYDTETGVKLFDESRVRNVEVEEPDFEIVKSKKENSLSIIQDVIVDMAEEMGEEICKTLSREPWKGYVISVTGEKIIISPGGNAGLTPGQVFEVYDLENTIQGVEGQKFFIPGEKIGEIRIDVVLPDRAVAVSVSGDEIKKGASLRLK